MTSNIVPMSPMMSQEKEEEVVDQLPHREEQLRMRQNDEIELKTLLNTHHNKINERINRIPPNSCFTSPILPSSLNRQSLFKSPNIVSPSKPPPTPTQKKATKSSKAPHDSKPTFSLPTVLSSKLFEASITLFLRHHFDDVLQPHSLSLTLVSMSLNIPMLQILNHIAFTSVSLELFFESLFDVRAKCFKLLKHLDNTFPLHREQRQQLKTFLEDMAQASSDVEWSELVERVVRMFLIGRIANTPTDQSLGKHLGYCDIDISPYLMHPPSMFPHSHSIPASSLDYEPEQTTPAIPNSYHKQDIVILQPPKSKPKSPKHFLVPLLLPEANGGMDRVDFIPGKGIIRPIS